MDADYVRLKFADLERDRSVDHAAQLCVYFQGECVVDEVAGGGINSDSLFAVFSCTKGIVYTALLLLVEDGLIDLDERVGAYWPEFSNSGKDEITVRQLCTHQAGLAGSRTGFAPDVLLDDAAIAATLAVETPMWPVGRRFGYHAYVIGALLGEIVKRVSGHSIQQIYNERILATHDIDFFLGVPSEKSSKVVDIIRGKDHRLRRDSSLRYRPERTIPGIARNEYHSTPTVLEDIVNSPAFRASGQTSFGGFASAKGLASFYSGVGGREDGSLLGRASRAEAAKMQVRGWDLVTERTSAYGLGFQLPGHTYPGVPSDAFGHDGAGGSLGFVVPSMQLAVGYTRRVFPTIGGAQSDARDLVTSVCRAMR